MGLAKSDIDAIISLFDELSPFIEKHTSVICPGCQNVCCIDRHSAPEDDDQKFFEIMKIERPGRPAKAMDMEPCRYLDERGCALARIMRPFKCTWYFCPPLLNSMTEDRGRDYRRFIIALNELLDLRRKVVE